MFGKNESESMSLEQLNNVAMNVIEGICASIAMPIELILRPWHGTRYFLVPTIFLSTMLMIALPALSALTDSVTQLIPGMGARPPVGIFGIGSFSKLYFLLSLVHGIRRWRRMIHMELEEHSEYEGNPLPIFMLFPNGQSFWWTRIVWEGAFVFAVATILGNINVFQTGLTRYLQIAAVALATKNAIYWFRCWEYLRKLLDIQFLGPILAKMADNRANDEDLAKTHMASFPKNLPPDIRKAAVSHIVRVADIPQGESHEHHS